MNIRINDDDDDVYKSRRLLFSLTCMDNLTRFDSHGNGYGIDAVEIKCGLK